MRTCLIVMNIKCPSDRSFVRLDSCQSSAGPSATEPVLLAILIQSLRNPWGLYGVHILVRIGWPHPPSQPSFKFRRTEWRNRSPHGP